MKRLIAVLIALACLNQLMLAEGVSPERQKLADEAYRARMEYTKSNRYSPYDSHSRDSQKKVNELYAKKDFKGVLKEADEGLKYDEFSIDLLMAKAAAYRELGQVDKADELRKQWFAIADSILLRGDGKSFETAWTVINVSEEYSVLSLLHCRMKQQFLEEHNGSQFDVLNVQPENSESIIALYFNIDAPMKNLNQKFSDPEAPKKK